MKCRTIVPAVLGVGLLVLASAPSVRAFDLLLTGHGRAAQKADGACQKDGKDASQKTDGAYQKDGGKCAAAPCRRPLFDGCWLRSRLCAPKACCEPCAVQKGDGASQKDGKDASQKTDGAWQKDGKDGAWQKGAAVACRPRLIDRIRAHHAVACCEPVKGDGAWQKNGDACQKNGK
mgnify:CR=1 FL=1